MVNSSAKTLVCSPKWIPLWLRNSTSYLTANLFFSPSDIYKSNKIVQNFQEILDYLFRPLFEVTNNPKSHPELHMFLQYVSQIYLLN